MSAETDDELWRFAVEFYSRDGVSETCLILQEAAGADIVQLLVIVYCDRVLQAPLSAAEIGRLREEMEPWRRMTVLPLRAIRQDLKRNITAIAPERETFRQQVKRLELSAERIQISMAARQLADRETEPGLPLEQALARFLDLSSIGDWRNDGRTSPALAAVTSAAGAFVFRR